MGTIRRTSGRAHRRLAAAVVAVGALTLAACGSDGEPEGGDGGTTDAGGGGGDISIGLVTKTETNPFFVTMREVAAEYAEEQGVQLTALAGAFDGDNEGQVQAMEDLIAQGVDGIMITPNNSTGLLGAIEQARAQGIVVVALDTATDPEDAVDATFATDNLEAGRLQGAYVRAALGDQDPALIMLDGTAGGTVDTFRHDGFLEGFGIEEGDPAILGMENTQGDQNNAQTAMENLLQRNPDVNAVYTINEPAARGAYAALEAQNLTDQGGHRVHRRRLPGRAGRRRRQVRRHRHAVPRRDGPAGHGRHHHRGERGRHAHRVRRHRQRRHHRQPGRGDRVGEHRVGPGELLGLSAAGRGRAGEPWHPTS